MTPYAAFLLLTATAVVLSVPARLGPTLRVAALVPLHATFALLYVFASDRVAQDRAEYFGWYRNAVDLLEHPNSRDQLFSWILAALPGHMSEATFGVVFASAFFFCAIAFAFTATRRMQVSIAAMPLVLLWAVVDRQFLDATLNATRGSLAAVLFLLGMTARRVPARLALWALAAGIHGRIAILCLVIYGVAWLLQHRPRLLRVAVHAGVVLFLARLVLGVAIVPELALFEVLLEQSESEGVRRGFATTAELTPSLAAQVAIAVVVPALLVLWQRAGARTGGDVVPRLGAGRTEVDLGAFGLLGGAVGLLLFPDLLLAQRLFILPILCLPFYLPASQLRALTIAKVALIAIALHGNLD